jgi:hypothetical protein
LRRFPFLDGPALGGAATSTGGAAAALNGGALAELAKLQVRVDGHALDADGLAALLALDDTPAGMTFRGRAGLPSALTAVLECEASQLALVLGAQAAADDLSGIGGAESDAEAPEGENAGPGAAEVDTEDTASTGSGSAPALQAGSLLQLCRASAQVRCLLLALEHASRSLLPSHTEDVATYLCSGDVSLGAAVQRWAQEPAADGGEEEGAGGRPPATRVAAKSKARAKRSQPTSSPAAGATVKSVQSAAGAGSDAGAASIQGARLTMALQACLHLALATEPLARETEEAAAASPEGADYSVEGSQTLKERLQRELALLSHLLVRRTAEVLPHRFTSLVRSLNRGVQAAIEAYVFRFVSPRLFAAQTVQLRAILAEAAAGGSTEAAGGSTEAAGATVAPLLAESGGAAALLKALPVAASPSVRRLVEEAWALRFDGGTAADFKPVASAAGAAATAFAMVDDVAAARRKLAQSLSREELKSLTSGDFTVKFSARARDVVATYRQEEAVLQLRITVPPSFPLQRVALTCEQRMGVSEERWRMWELQMMTLLSSKDGSLLQALQFWKENLDKTFENVEPCPICFAVIHITNRGLPNMTWFVALQRVDVCARGKCECTVLSLARWLVPWGHPIP